MELHEKWSLTSQEMELVSLLPYHVSYMVASADGVINPEETTPYKIFINLKRPLIQKYTSKITDTFY